MSALTELVDRFDSLPKEQVDAAYQQALSVIGNRKWVPNPGPQTMARASLADEMFFGGCVSEDTEFLSPQGWVKISEYSGETIAQWKDGVIGFVDPEYLEYPCKELIHFQHSRLSMMLSDDHRMPLYDYRDNFIVKKACDVAENPSRHKVPVNFTVPHKGLPMSDDLIRIGVAIHADGNLTYRKKDGGAHCRISLRKTRKIDRLLTLFSSLDINPHIYKNPNRPTEIRYGFDSPILTKQFVGEWWGANQHQLEIILEEMSHWDGNYSGVNGGDISFCSTNKIDADFIQYAAHACGRVATLRTAPACGNASALHNVYISHLNSPKSTVTLRVDAVRIDRIPALFMYCFRVPSTFWVARHNGCIFITGNSAGGGKSELLLGMAIEEHEKSIIFRRFQDDARDLADRFLEIEQPKVGWNGQLLTFKDKDRKIEFRGIKDEKDKQRFKGRPHDLIGFDEICDFPYSVYAFVKAWNRSAKGHRSRVICTGNPPTDPEGLWVIEYWAPWLDPDHSNPAKDGELRWFVQDANDMSMEVAGPGNYEIEGETLTARSRTFIRASLVDNPDLLETDYDAVLSALPSQLREAYREGLFKRTLRDNPMQCIPAAWVKAAQDRWTDQPPRGIPMNAIGVDPAQGGEDWNIIAPRYDRWWDKLVKIPGKDTPIGTDLLAPILEVRRDNAVVVIDAGGGYGSATYGKLEENNIPVYAHKGSTGSNERSICRFLYEFANERTKVYWRFRELLDPTQPGGSQAMLPPDTRLFADLTAPLYKIKGNVVHLETKEDLVKRLGRSPDEGDAVVNSWSKGDKIENRFQDWRNGMSGNKKPIVNNKAWRKRR